MVTGRPSFPLPRLRSARFPVGASTALTAASTRFHTSSPPHARPAAPGEPCCPSPCHVPGSPQSPPQGSPLSWAFPLQAAPARLHLFVGGFSLLVGPCSPHSRVGWRIYSIARHTSNGPQTKAAESWYQHANFFIPGTG